MVAAQCGHELLRPAVPQATIADKRRFVPVLRQVALKNCRTSIDS
ncbi:MAG: hypothetical protein ACUVQM_00340 [Candidatus Hadarchaeaceae archaeon]